MPDSRPAGAGGESHSASGPATSASWAFRCAARSAIPPVMATAPATSSGCTGAPVRASAAGEVALLAFDVSDPFELSDAPGGTKSGSGGCLATLFNPHATLANDASVGAAGWAGG